MTCGERLFWAVLAVVCAAAVVQSPAVGILFGAAGLVAGVMWLVNRSPW